jgi:hypothetical protein
MFGFLLQSFKLLKNALFFLKKIKIKIKVEMPYGMSQ